MYSYQQNRLEKSLRIIENWRKTGLILVCLAALVIDSLFLFIPVIDSHRFCYIFDKKLGATACVLRTCIDTFYVILIFFHNFTQHIAPRTQVFRGELFVHSTAIRERCLFCHFIIDIISVLPIPQVVFLTFISQRQHAASLVSKQILKWIVLGQYIPRIIRIYPLFKDMTRAFATVAETKWIGAGLNLFLYMLQSCVFGGFWYLIAIEKKDRCWREACTKASGCDLANVYCARGSGDNRQFLNTTCLLIDPDQITNSTIFNFGIYIDALKSGMVESRDFPRKFFYCLWWGLRNVSALGQNLETSNSLDEILFAIIICVSGLILFAVLIGNVQKYLLSTTIRVEEMEEKRRDTEKWMYYRKLPETLKGRIRRSEEYKWRQTRGTEEETFLRNLPTNLRLETKRHIYVDILKRVPLFYCMDDRLLDALCDRLKMVLYTEDSYILREGEPIVEMLFIARGKLKIKRNGNYLRDGDFCGDDLLYWALESHTYHLPISGETIQVVSEVEGFVLSGDDLKIVLTENSHHFDSKQFQFIVRYYSRGWQMWAANLIQVQWWRHVRRKLSKSFCEEKCTLHNIKPGQNIHLHCGSERKLH